MYFSKDFPDKLRSSILASEVVGKKVKLKSRGKESQGLCPFHNEKTPSFTVNDVKGFYHCFGCAAHGDIISFVMNTEGLEYKEAVIKLANDFGIAIPQVKQDAEKENKTERDILILEKICQFFEKNLFSAAGSIALAYLQKRRIANSTIKKFRLGFALNSYDSLTNFLKNEGFTDTEIAACGVIGKNDQSKLYDKLRNRVIFPITDKKNRVIAFGGRTIGDDLPKYLNSAETALFKKSQNLYNFYFARKAIFSKGYAVVVEGYMDAISLFTSGLENVVAGLGTALGQDHLQELFFTTDKIVICLDGDSAGVRAAKRVSEIALPLINSKKNIAFAFLPNQMDPDDFVKEFGATELEKIFEKAVPLSESMFEFALIDLGLNKNKKISAEEKAKLEAALTLKIEAIKDVTSKKYFSLFFKDLLFSLGRNKGVFKQKLAVENRIYAASTNNVTSSTADLLGKNIVALIVAFPHLAHFRDESFDIKEMPLFSEKMTHLKDLVIEAVEENSESNTDEIIKTLEKSGANKDISDIISLVAGISAVDLNLVMVKFNILLLKDLLLQVDQQYKEVLSKTDEIETHQTAITNQKITEIFDYKNSLEHKILSLEKEIM